MRKKKHPEHVNHERWLISYADFITLLFAFFVVMFAVSQVDTKKVGRFTESFSKAVGVELFMDPGHGILPASESLAPPRSEADKDTSLSGELKDVRAALITKGQSAKELKSLEVQERRNELVLRLPMGLLFDSGDDALKPTALPVLRSIAAEVRNRPVNVRVEGHTDDRPIRTARFHSNWDLSAARATAVIMELSGAGGIAPPRLSASGYGEFHPLASNGTFEGRAKNRRVDLVLHDSAPSSGVPNVALEDGGISVLRDPTDRNAKEPDDAGVDAAHRAEDHNDKTEHHGHEERTHGR